MIVEITISYLLSYYYYSPYWDEDQAKPPRSLLSCPSKTSYFLTNSHNQSKGFQIPCICLRTFKSCLELLFQLNQVVFSNIFCYLFLSRDISARKEKKFFIRWKVLKCTSRWKKIDLCVSAFNYRWKYVQYCLVDNQ